MHEELEKAAHDLEFAVENLLAAHRKAPLLEKLVISQVVAKAREARSLLTQLNCAVQPTDVTPHIRPPVK